MLAACAVESEPGHIQAKRGLPLLHARRPDEPAEHVQGRGGGAKRRRGSGIIDRPDGMIASITDPLSRTTVFTRDAVGRVVAEERPDLAVTTLGYDLEGNNTAVVPPSKPAHGMTYNLVELLDSYTPPALATGGGATEYAYDLDRALTEVLQPGPRLVEHTYDAAGRPGTTTFPGGVITRAYHPTTGKLTTLAGPDVTLSSTYDGALLTSVAMTGPVSGTLSWQHDTAFRVVEERINGAHSAAFDFDDDLLTQAGGLILNRDPATGFVTQATAGLVAEAWTNAWKNYLRCKNGLPPEPLVPWGQIR